MTQSIERRSERRPTWGIDLTDVSLRAAKVDLGPDGQPRLIAWDLVDFTEDVEDTQDVARFLVMQRACGFFRNRHVLRRSRVYIDIRGETAFNRTVTVPPVNDESLDRILEYEAQQQIPFPLAEVFWDRRVVSINESGEVRATLYAVKRTLVEDRLRKTGKSRLPVDGVQLRPIGLQNFCAMEQLLEDGTIVIDVDYDGIQVLIHHDDQTWFRCLPVGGVDFVARLRETFKVPHRTGVRMATGDAKIPDADHYELCRDASQRQIGAEILRTVRYYLAARPDVKPSGIVLFESHACVPPMGAFLKQALDLPVYKPRGFRHIQVDPAVVTAGIQENFGGLAKAAGLALQGVGKAEVGVRLYPADLERTFSSRRTGYFAAALALVATLGLSAFQQRSDAATLERRMEVLQSEFARAGRRSEMDRVEDARPVFDQIAVLATPAVGRAGALPILERLLAARDEFASTEAPHVVAISHGAGTPHAAGSAQIVLAATVETDVAEADVRLDRMAATLTEAGLVKEVVAIESWIAAWPTASRPAAAETRLLRWPLRHRSYQLILPPESSR